MVLQHLINKINIGLKTLILMAQFLKEGIFLRCFYGLAISTENFASEVKFMLGLENTCPDGYVAKIGLNGP